MPDNQGSGNGGNGRSSVALADLAHGEDLLGYQPYIDEIAGIISSPHLDTPFSVGVYGPWGTGKSTFMFLLMQQLHEPRKHVHALMFQPWQFDEKREVWKALILTILEYLDRINSEVSRAEEEQKEIDRALGALFNGIGRVALNEVFAHLTSGRVSFDQLASDIAKSERDTTQFINTFRREFKSVRDEILGNDAAKLVILVDDLDRCTPENCIMVLEAIKLFFDMEGYVFVIGIDRDIVQKGIEIKYQKIGLMHGQDYLEKIIQLPFVLPPVAAESFRLFVNRVTAGFGFNETSRELLIRASDSNPRRLKRLSNCLYLVSNVARSISSRYRQPNRLASVDDNKLALLLVMQVRFPRVYHWYTRNPMKLRDLVDSQKRYEEIGVDKKELELLSEIFAFALNRQGVDDFTDDTELYAYLRLTGLVAEPSDVGPHQTIDHLDDRFARNEEGQAESEAVPHDVRQVEPPEIEEIPDLIKQAESVLSDWQSIWALSTWQLLKSNLNELSERTKGICVGGAELKNILNKTAINSGSAIFVRGRSIARELEKVSLERFATQLDVAGKSIVRLSRLAIILWFGIFAVVFNLEGSRYIELGKSRVTEEVVFGYLSIWGVLVSPYVVYYWVFIFVVFLLGTAVFVVANRRGYTLIREGKYIRA